MNDSMWKKSLIATTALLAASAKAPANPVTKFIDKMTLNASAAVMDEVSPFDFDEDTTAEESLPEELPLNIEDTTTPTITNEIPEYGVYADSRFGKVDFVSNSNDRGAYHNLYKTGTGMAVNITPYDGYNISRVYAEDNNGQIIDLTKNTDTQYIMTIPESDVTVHVEYTKQQYTAVNNSYNNTEYSVKIDSAHGKVNLLGKNKDSKAASASLMKAGEAALVIIKPDSGYEVANVYASCSSGATFSLYPVKNNDNTYTIVMPASDVTIHVEYEKEQAPKYDIDVTSENGTYELYDSSYNKSGNTLSAGESATLEIRPKPGYVAVAVSVVDADGRNIAVTKVAGESIYKFTMPQSDVKIDITYLMAPDDNKDYGVFFDNDYDLGNIEIKGIHNDVNSFMTMKRDQSAYIKVTPKKGYTVADVYATDHEGNRIILSCHDNTYVLKMPSDDVTIHTVYEKEYSVPSYDVFVHSYKGSGRATVWGSTWDNSGKIMSGDRAILKIKPDTGYEVKSVTVKDKDHTPIDVKNTANSGEYTFIMPDSDASVEIVYSESMADIAEIRYDGTKTSARVDINDYSLPKAERAGYEIVGWKIGSDPTVYSEEDAQAMIRLSYGMSKTQPIIVQTVYEETSERVSEENSGYSVSITADPVMCYTDYKTGRGVFKLDFKFNNDQNRNFKGGVIEFEFDHAIDRFEYGADIGNRTVTVDEKDPRKVTIDFTTYNPYGESSSSRSGSMFIVSKDMTSALNCVNARVVSVK